MNEYIVRIAISKTLKGYVITLSKDGSAPKRIRDLPVNSEMVLGLLSDLNRLLDDARRSIQIIMEKSLTVRISPEDLDAIRTMFSKVAAVGYNSYSRIFVEDDGRDQIKEALESIPDTKTAILIFRTEEFNFPWELLYIENPFQNFNYHDFLGFKYVIYRQFLPSSRSRYAPQDIYAPSSLLGLIADESLTYVPLEIEFLAKAVGDKLKQFRCDLDTSRRKELFYSDLTQFFKQKMHTVHFACHTAKPKQDRHLHLSSDAYCFMLSSQYSLCPSDIENARIAFVDWPIIFLNTCSSSESADQEYYSRWGSVKDFLARRGASSVIATECVIPDIFAMEFAKAFYPLLWKNKRLGSALLETRQQFLEEYQNPLGLLYSLYASNPPIRLHLDVQQQESSTDGANT